MVKRKEKRHIDKKYIPDKALFMPLNSAIDKQDTYSATVCTEFYNDHPSCPNSGKVYTDTETAKWKCLSMRCRGTLSLEPEKEHPSNWCGHKHMCKFFYFLCRQRAGRDIAYKYKDVDTELGTVKVKKNQLIVEIPNGSSFTSHIVNLDKLDLGTYYGLKDVARTILARIDLEVFDYDKPTLVEAYEDATTDYTDKFADPDIAKAIKLLENIQLVQCIHCKDNHRLHKWFMLYRRRGWLETVYALANLPCRGDYRGWFIDHCYFCPADGVCYSKNTYPKDIILYRYRQKKGSIK